MLSGQIIRNSAEVTLNGGLVREFLSVSSGHLGCLAFTTPTTGVEQSDVRESLQNPLNSGLGIVPICPGNVVFILQGLHS